MRLKIFLISLLISLPFWWGINVFEKSLEDFFFWKITENYEPCLLFSAQLNQTIKSIKAQKIKDLEVDAKSAISVEIFPDSPGQEKILFEKNSDKILPIASITKLFTAYTVLENYKNLSQIVEISEKAANQIGNGSQKLNIGQKFKVKELLYPMLIESNNSAAYALAELFDKEEKEPKAFVDLMNLEVKNLGLKNTYFINPTGLEPENINQNLDCANFNLNCSTAKDLKEFVKYLLFSKKKELYDLIWEILKFPEFEFYSLNGTYYKLINTNKLLGTIPEIKGGKTGYTEKAGECFLLVLENPKRKSFIVNVILGAKDRFKEMKKIIEAIN